MMANNALALNVATPTIDPVGAFEVGQQAGQQQAMAKLQQAEAGLKHLGQLAFGVMGGKLDGPVDPALWDEAVATLGPEGAKYKGRPDLAPILAKASVDTLGQLQVAQNEKELDLRLQEFQFRVDEAAKPKVTDDMAELAQINAERVAAGQPKLSTEEFLKGKGGGVSVTNIMPGGESGGASVGQFQKDLGGIMAKDYGTLRDDAKAARGALASLNLMEQAVKDPSFYSGIGNEQVLALKRMAAAVGIDPEGVSSMETFNALNKQAALDVMGGSLGTGFSNADRDFVIEQVPNLGNTPEGNLKLIEIQRKLAERKIEIAKMATDYVQENGVLDANFEDELSSFADANPVFSKEDAATAEAPEGIDPGLWEFLTPEERLLWQN